MEEIYQQVAPEKFVRNEITGFKRTKLPTLERLNQLLVYRDGMLFWRVVRGGGVKAGDRAGSINKYTGYRIIGIDGKVFKEHHIAWMIAKQEELPVRNEEGYELVMDHSNGNKVDNRIENLVAITNAENVAKQFRDEIKLAKNGDKLLTGVQQKGIRFIVQFSIRSFWRSENQGGGTIIAASFPTQLEASAFKIFLLEQGHGDQILKLLDLREEDQETIEKLYSGEIGKTGHRIRDFTIKPEFQEIYDREIKNLRNAGF